MTDAAAASAAAARSAQPHSHTSNSKHASHSSTASADAAPRPLTPARACVAIVAALVPALLVGLGARSLDASIPGSTLTAALVFAINLVGWAHGSAFRTERCYDLLGTGSFASATVFSLWRSRVWSQSDSRLWSRQLLLSALVLLWAVRLGSHLVVRVFKAGEDRRFRVAKQSPIRYLAYWSGQAMWALLVGGPVYLVNLQPEAPAASSTPAHAAFAYVPLVDPVSIGLTLYVLGLFIEWRADAEKAAFKHAPHSATRKPWIDTGMWALSRHPNYLGEIMLWTGISLMAADSIQQPTAATVTACVLSPLFLTLLLTRVSGIPLLEEHADKSFGHDAAYQAYKARTGVLLPLPLDRAVRFAWRLMWACTAFAAAYFCGRMFTYVAHSMKIPLTEPTAWPFYFTQPLHFELLPVALATAHPALRVLVNTLWNVLLVAQFGFCHVGFARPAVYRACGSRYHRVLFMLVTCASFHLIILLWRHNPGLIVWDGTPLMQSALALAGLSVSRATVVDVLVPLWGLIFIILCLSTVFKLDVLYFIGAKQPLMSDEEEQKENEEFARELVARETYYAKQKANNKAAAASSSSSSSTVSEPVHGQKQLMVSGMYRFVRHPMYFWLQTLCVCTPFMTFDRLVYSAATTALLWIGLRFEERKLVREFGNDYVEYQKRTPMLFPDWRMCKSQKKKGKTQ